MPVKKISLIVLCIACVLFFSAFQQIKYSLSRLNYLVENKSGTLQFTFDYAATTPLLNPPYISGVIDDPTDPCATKGFVVDIKENNDPIDSGGYTLSAASDNTLIVHEDKIIIAKANGEATVKIIPSGFGYSNITLTLTRNKEISTLLIYYASSSAADIPENAFWYSGISNASAVVALDSDYMVIGDDEVNGLFVYHRYQSGLPVAEFNYARLMQLPEGPKEIDCEAGTRSLKNPQRTYWTGSMSNGGRKYKDEPNRSCLFATDITGTGTNTKFSYKGNYLDLRKQLIKWGDANGYNLSSAAAPGATAKNINGFNVEGIVFAPDSTTLYIGFRAPIVPVSNRTKALIAPIENFETWFNTGNPIGNPSIGAPIELNLGGRGIRDFIRLNDGSYVIIAGNSDEILNAALYTWSGKATDNPVVVNMMDVFTFKAESGLEIDDNGKFTGKVQLISDNGSNIFYNDDVEAKQLQKNLQKFRSDIVGLHQSPEK